ncbi:hypothetical protein PM082_016758 [Marasmius tenuissimus]|nr:hypothetical protein PM082_016758 [Marasmius tenuissimus]
MFHSASHINITGGSFNIIHGTQNNNHYYPDSQSSSERRMVRIQPGEEWKEMLYQEYERIHIWRINLLRTLHRAEYRPGLQAWRWHMGTFHKVDYPEANRVVEIASIVDRDGRNESKPLLAVKYTGRGAKKLFAGDCMLFSRQRTTNLAQLRAYNDSDIPIIIFNKELISLEHFLKYNKSSAEALCYVRLWHDIFDDYLRQGLLNSWFSSHPFPEFVQLMWFRPQTGALCLGPPQPELISEPGWLMYHKDYKLVYGHRSLNFFHANYWHPMLNAGGLDHHDLPGNHFQFPPSPRDAGSRALFDYLIYNFPERMVLSAVCWDGWFITFGLQDEDARTRTMSLIDGGLFSDHILALPFHRWENLSAREYHGIYRAMENREMRFPIDRAADQTPEWFSFKQYEECSTNCERGEDWLAQAGRIFTHFGIPRREWESCSPCLSLMEGCATYSGILIFTRQDLLQKSDLFLILYGANSHTSHGNNGVTTLRSSNPRATYSSCRYLNVLIALPTSRLGFVEKTSITIHITPKEGQQSPKKSVSRLDCLS